LIKVKDIFQFEFYRWSWKSGQCAKAWEFEACLAWTTEGQEHGSLESGPISVSVINSV